MKHLPTTSEIESKLRPLLPSEPPGQFQLHKIAVQLSENLVEPIRDLVARPSKGFRARLVDLGYGLARDVASAEHAPRDLKTARQLEEMGQLIEALHTASLAIDDIEDQSSVRRGGPTLHLKYGLPIALNASNWLYFWPLDRLSDLDLEPQQELAIYRCVHSALTAAHCGQALDLTTDIENLPCSEVDTLCLASLYLKSGILFSLAFELGAIIAGASPEVFSLLSQTGRQLGAGLQMFDDIGTMLMPVDHPKRFEDFRLRRMTWVWKIVCQYAAPEELLALKAAMRSLPKPKLIEEWMRTSLMPSLAIEKAQEHMDQTLNALEVGLASCLASRRGGDIKVAALDSYNALGELEDMVTEITKAYWQATTSMQSASF